MTQASGDQPGARATADDMDEPLGDNAATGATQQTSVDAQEKRKHPSSENALPTSQEKNPVPPASTRE